jgi:aldose sugar dehydrogenase
METDPLAKETAMTGSLRHATALFFMGFAIGFSAPAASQQQHPDEVETTAEVPMADGWRKTTLVEGLEHPWGMAFLPDGTILVTEREGRMRLIRDEELEDDPVEGVPDVFASNQGGLLDVALHPDFKENRWVYFTYAAGDADANRTTVARGRLSENKLEDVEDLFVATPDKSRDQHFGSRIAWLPDGTMLVSIGDGGNPPLEIDGTPARDHGQRLDSHLGSIVRLNDDGSVPDDNPFVDRDDALPEIFSYGHRNIQGLAVDPVTGNIWASEHGPLGGDELNLIRPGENYGWPKTTFGADYRTGERFTPHRTREDMTPPKVAWVPAVAPSGLEIYNGDAFPDWRGSVFSGGLVGQDVRRIIVDGDEVTGQETLPIAERVRAVKQGPDGKLYILTDSEEGELIRIEPDD